MKMEQPIKVMNKEQIIDEAYVNFKKWYNEHSGKEDYTGYYVPTKEEFIRLIKTDSEFSEKWGLQIGERELSVRERLKLVGCKDDVVIESVINSRGEEFHKNKMDKQNIPTKLIKITYNNETIESYE